MTHAAHDDNFRGRLVVVTGGAGALGGAVVHTLVNRGARVWVPCLDDSEALIIRSRHESSVESIAGVDLTHEAATERFYARVAQEGPLWASINIAGGFAMSPVEKTSKDDLLAQHELNTVTCFLCCREAAKQMPSGGRIVNVAARPALRPEQGAGMAAYTMSKAAVAALTAAMAAEVRERGILVNAIAPSIIDTPANRRSMPDANFDRWPKPVQIAETIAFLASHENSLTSGQVVPVFGGA